MTTTSSRLRLRQAISSWGFICVLNPDSKVFRAILRYLSRVIYSKSTTVKAIKEPIILDLPFELAEAILLEMEWQDVFRMRMVCRVFYVASKSRFVWEKLFTSLSNSYALPILTPKPLQAYSPPELENFVTKWLRSEWGWSSSTLNKLPTSRVIRTDITFENTHVLIDGGRWLLESDRTDNGTIYCYDLASQTPHLNRFPLIQPETQDYYAKFISFCVDHTAPHLEFNLAVPYRPVSQDPLGKISIWRVIQSVTASGVDTLFATHDPSLLSLIPGFNVTYLTGQLQVAINDTKVPFSLEESL
ncbi:hypothetical protein ONZ45_g15396 [Pleurotus djamor]|nr:hypothetical protein ONZ45_g15396 [Pleurotus djamor]